MDTSEKTQEQISAFADGELDDPYIDSVLTALRRKDGRDRWELYHQIGDVLRSDDMAIALSPEFSTRMVARLEMEPTIVASADTMRSSSQDVQPLMVRNGNKYWMLSGIAAAVVMAVSTLIAMPHVMTEKQGSEIASASAKTVVAQGPEGIVVRDQRIDDYLLAHQRFSPSVYSTAQYARSAAFQTESGK